MTDTPFETGRTPYGVLYEPRGGGTQFCTLCLGFFGGPILGMAMGTLLGGLSETAQLLLFLPFVTIFFFGYALWVGRLNLLAFDTVGRGALRALFTILVARQRPTDADDFLPDRQRILELAVKGQKAAWSFVTVAVGVALLSTVAALGIESTMSAGARILTVGSGCLIWGFCLGWLGRHGYLPMGDTA